MNAPDFPPLKLQTVRLKAAERLALQTVRLAFDYLVEAGTSLEDIQRRFAAHVLAMHSGNIVETAIALETNAKVITRLLTATSETQSDVSLKSGTEATDRSIHDVMPLHDAPKPFDRIVQTDVNNGVSHTGTPLALVDALLTDPELLASAVLQASQAMANYKDKDRYPWQLLDPLIEVRYRQGMGATSMLRQPEFSGVKLQAVKTRCSALKLSHRFPAAAAEIKRNASGNIVREIISPNSYIVQATTPMAPAAVAEQPIVITTVEPSHSWTPALVTLLSEHYPNEGISILNRPEFSHFTAKAISVKAGRLQVKRAVFHNKTGSASKPDKTLVQMPDVPQVLEITTADKQTDADRKIMPKAKTLQMQALLPLLRRLVSEGAAINTIRACPEFAHFGRSTIFSHVSRVRHELAAETDLQPAFSTGLTVNKAADNVVTVVAVAAETTAPQAIATVAAPTQHTQPAGLPARPVPVPQPRMPPMTPVFTPSPRSLCAGMDMDQERAKIAARKAVALRMTLQTLGDLVTKGIDIEQHAITRDSDTPVQAAARQLRAHGFNSIAHNHESKGAAKQAYLSDFYWHKAGVLADIIRGGRLLPTLRLHAQLINVEGNQPLLKPLSLVPQGGRYLATCSVLNGERKVTCVTIEPRSLEDGLTILNKLLGSEVLLLKKLAVPPRGDDCGLITFKGSSSHHKRLTLGQALEPLRPLCFEGTRAVFVTHL